MKTICLISLALVMTGCAATKFGSVTRISLGSDLKAQSITYSKEVKCECCGYWSKETGTLKGVNFKQSEAVESAVRGGVEGLKGGL